MNHTRNLIKLLAKWRNIIRRVRVVQSKNNLLSWDKHQTWTWDWDSVKLIAMLKPKLLKSELTEKKCLKVNKSMMSLKLKWWSFLILILTYNNITENLVVIRILKSSWLLWIEWWDLITMKVEWKVAKLITSLIKSPSLNEKLPI